MPRRTLTTTALLGFAAHAALAQPGADFCVDATPVFGEATVSFNLALAVTDGMAHTSCLERPGDAQIVRDVWWLWTATCDGPARVTSCGLTTADTKIVVYALGGPCPPTDDYILACSDQACGDQAEATFVARAGQQYLVRLGQYPGSGGFTGQARFECVGDAMGEGEHCRTGGNAVLTARIDASRVALQWTAPADGVIDSLCVTGSPVCGQWGLYDNPRLRVVYYTDLGGRPGPVIASFAPDDVGHVGAWQAGGGAGSAGFYTQALKHEPIAVSAGQIVWVEATSERLDMCWSWRLQLFTEEVIAVDTTPLDHSWANAALENGSLDRCIGFRAAPCAPDVNADGAVNFADLNEVLNAYNAPCP